ncbi:MAG: hypothetical protein IAB99_05455 [Bacteroidetes bacterium]|uniref:Uncharacterized protein n=1 Tax=Candidatus Cryptobacteroides faecipullorum TaxID=2840764 RepID=A0A9D9NBJ9_9BACT|nr:hypothetical protein [Candidatus Cryptobacteroides faecipullorum]
MKTIFISTILCIVFNCNLYTFNHYLQNGQKDSTKLEKLRIKEENKAKVGTKELILTTDFTSKELAAEFIINYLTEMSIDIIDIDPHFYFILTGDMKCSDANIGPGSLNTFRMKFFFTEINDKIRIKITGKWKSNVQLGYMKDEEEHQLIFENKKAYSTYDAFLKMEKIATGIPHTDIEYVKADNL